MVWNAFDISSYIVSRWGLCFPQNAFVYEINIKGSINSFCVDIFESFSF